MSVEKRRRNIPVVVLRMWIWKRLLLSLLSLHLLKIHSVTIIIWSTDWVVVGSIYKWRKSKTNVITGWSLKKDRNWKIHPSWSLPETGIWYVVGNGKQWTQKSEPKKKLEIKLKVTEITVSDRKNSAMIGMTKILGRW